MLGYPTTDELRNADGKGRYNNCQNGKVTWTPSTGAVVTHGADRTVWRAAR